MSEKLIHVNAYVKQDGTQVREHYRGGGSNQEANTFTEGTVLQGGVSEYDWYTPTTKDKVAGAIGVAVDIAKGALPVVVAIGKAISERNAAEAARLKPIISEYIGHLNTTQQYMQQTLDNNLKILANTKNPTEYTKQYKEYVKDLEIYNKSQDAYNRIKYLTEQGNYTQLQEELNNYYENNKPQTIKSPNLLEGNNRDFIWFDNYLNTSDPKVFWFSTQQVDNILWRTINNYKNKNNPDAKLFMDLALTLPDNVASSPQYQIISPDLNQAINENLRLESDALKIPKGWSGVLFDRSSSVSRTVSNSPQLQRQIREKFVDGKFTSDKLRGLGFSEDPNLHLSIGHYTVINPRIDSNGVFKGLLYDKYDFDLLYGTGAVEPILINNFAFVLQTTGNIKNYYVFVPIEFKW